MDADVIKQKNKRKKNHTYAISSAKDFTCVLPALVLLAVFTYYPIVEVIRISFTDWNLINDSYQYVGLKNWKWLFAGSGTKYLLNSLKVTALYSLGEIAITLGGGLLFALLFNRITKTFSVLRAVVFMPRYVAMSSAAVVFIWIFNKDNGVLNYFLQTVGLNKVDWLGNKNVALISVLILNTPPGLYLQDMVSGIPAAFSRNSICVKSSKLIVALIPLAFMNSSAGVALEENITSFSRNPSASESINSVKEEQSTPQPSSCRIFKINGFGVAFTAKYSLNPLFQANAAFNLLAFSRIPFSSYI